MTPSLHDRWLLFGLVALHQRLVARPALEAALVAWRTDTARALSQVLRPHARGGFGEVFVALDGELKREIALKEIQARHADNADSRKHAPRTPGVPTGE